MKLMSLQIKKEAFKLQNAENKNTPFTLILKIVPMPLNSKRKREREIFNNLFYQ
jgi:hypothetical protein